MSGYRAKNSRRSSGPTPRQLSYLNTLAEQAGYAGGTSGRPFRERFGLIEANAWGGRFRSEAVTSAAVSAWIDTLRGEINAAGQEAE